MKEIFVNNSLNYLKKHNACNKKQENIFKYTLESLYSFVTKTLVILIFSILLNSFEITAILLVCYSILRGFTFGIHATKNIYCWIISLSVYVLFPFLIKHFYLPIQFIYFMFFIGIIAILLWAPADTKARPLLNRKKRIVNKLISLCISLIYIIGAFELNNYNFKEIVSILFLLNTVCICPLTYYIFRLPYKNYRFYNKK